MRPSRQRAPAQRRRRSSCASHRAIRSWWWATPAVCSGSSYPAARPAAPLAAALAAIGAPSPEQRRRAMEGTLAGARVWIADDDPDAHEVVALTLKQSGATVQSFGSGRQLVAALESVL